MHLIGDKDYHQGAFAIIDVEAEVRSHARLRVDHLQMKEDKKQIVNTDKTNKQKNKKTNKQNKTNINLKVWNCKLAMKSKLEAGGGCSVGVQQHVRELEDLNLYIIYYHYHYDYLRTAKNWDI